MDKKKIKKTIKNLLQYGWVWGWPNSMEKEGWDAIKEYYKEELNGGKRFVPDESKKAKASLKKQR